MGRREKKKGNERVDRRKSGDRENGKKREAGRGKRDW